MTTLLTARADGRVIGRCNQSCYASTGRRCQCICDGANHGLGFRQALNRNTKENRDALRVRLELRGHQDVQLDALPRQLELFP